MSFVDKVEGSHIKMVRNKVTPVHEAEIKVFPEEERDAVDSTQQSPYDRASWLSRLTLWWMIGVIKSVKHKDYEVTKCRPIAAHDSKTLVQTLQRSWSTESRKDKPSLFLAALKAFSSDLLIMIPLSLVYSTCLLSLPTIVGLIVDFFSGTGSTTRDSAMMLGGAMVGVTLIFSCTNMMVFYLSTLLGLKLRAAFTGIIYEKILFLDSGSRQSLQTGKIINMMASDLETLTQLCMGLPILWLGPVHSIAGLILIGTEFGVSSLTCVAYFAIIFTINIKIGRVVGDTRVETAVRTDKRIQMMNEIIAGMSIIKMYCWEKPYSAIISKLRESEMDMLFKGLSWIGLPHAGMYINGRLAAYIAFLAYTLAGGTLRPQSVVKIVGWLEIVQWDASAFVVYLAELMESRTSLSRIQNLLESQENVAQHDVSTHNNVDIELEDLETVWFHENKKDKAFSLRIGSLKTNKGAFIAVIGPVGSGKSSFLLSLLGEMSVVEGSIKALSSVSYAPQQPWILNASIRDNILFGYSFDKEKYDKVVYACSLTQDFNLFPKGDATLVGERGNMLSGGQKARVGLARALYTDQDVYLLDDPLSAVDSKVAQHIVKHAINGYLRGKTRILVTHHVQFIKEADHLMVFLPGKCIYSGDPNKFDMKNEINNSNDVLSSKLEQSNTVTDGNTKKIAKEVADPEPEEDEVEGDVSWRVYYEYFKAGNGHIWFICYLILSVPMQVTYIMSDWWLSEWAKYEDSVANNGSSGTTISPNDVKPEYYHLQVYSALIVCLLILALGRQFALFTFTIKASYNLHNTMFWHVIRAPLAFFERNPVGVILNKFSRDVGFMDSQLAKIGSLMFSELINILGFLIFVLVINPYMTIAAVPFVIAIYLLRRYTLSAGRELKMLESNARSPIYSHVSASLEGHVIIRAFRKETEFIDTFHRLQNSHTSVWFLYLSCYRWMMLWISMVSTVYMVAVLIGAFIVISSGIDGTLLGFALVYNVLMVDIILFTLNLSAEFANTMTSVERILEYTDLPLEPDQPYYTDLPPDWPAKGSILLHDVSMKYDKGDKYSLKNITLGILGGQKVGVMGRTGAGKSSLIKVILRLVQYEGRIFIDGVDISELRLKQLRNKISVIPQDPVLFTGTIRDNLDPFEAYPDEILWLALEQVELKSLVMENKEGLSWEVGEAGSNFSVGQKQLVCLARALIEQNSILLIDEATANVDYSTDALIQKTIRTVFKKCTVITIAHRLNTIADSDRILVLEDGKLKQVEFLDLVLDSFNA